MSRITTVVFDMYETLVRNELGFWHATFDTILREQGLDTSRQSLWEVWVRLDQDFRVSRYREGVPFLTYYAAWRECFVKAFDLLGVEGDAAAAAQRSILDLSRRPPYPETLKSVAMIQRKWHTGLLSNADDNYLFPALGHLGVNFEAVLTSEQARAYKPNPSLFHEVLRRLGRTAEESVYVGDRQFEDVKGASQVGMHTVWINRNGAKLDPKLPSPDHQISSLLELPKLLEQA